MSPREIFKGSGESYPEEEREEMEEKARKYHVEYREKSPELEALLERIDFDILRGIYEEFAAKSGVDAEELNFLGEDRISPANIGAPVNLGEYDSAKNVIGLNYSRIKERSEDNGLNSDISFLRTLCHEEVHATSGVRCFIASRGNSIIGKDAEKVTASRIKVGYSVYSYGEGSSFFLFNEGITEKMGREIADEYARRSGFASEDEMEEYSLKYNKKFPDRAYNLAVQFVDTLIRALSQKTGVSEKQVWRALKRGMFQGDVFSDEELREEFSETFGEEFLEKLEQAGKDEINELTFDLISEEDEEETLISKLKDLVSKFTT